MSRTCARNETAIKLCTEENNFLNRRFAIHLPSIWMREHTVHTTFVWKSGALACNVYVTGWASQRARAHTETRTEAEIDGFRNDKHLRYDKSGGTSLYYNIFIKLRVKFSSDITSYKGVNNNLLSKQVLNLLEFLPNEWPAASVFEFSLTAYIRDGFYQRLTSSRDVGKAT